MIFFNRLMGYGLLWPIELLTHTGKIISLIKEDSKSEASRMLLGSFFISAILSVFAEKIRLSQENILQIFCMISSSILLVNSVSFYRITQKNHYSIINILIFIYFTLTFEILSPIESSISQTSNILRDFINTIASTNSENYETSIYHIILGGITTSLLLFVTLILFVSNANSYIVTLFLIIFVLFSLMGITTLSDANEIIELISYIILFPSILIYKYTYPIFFTLISTTAGKFTGNIFKSRFDFFVLTSYISLLFSFGLLINDLLGNLMSVLFILTIPIIQRSKKYLKSFIQLTIFTTFTFAFWAQLSDINWLMASTILTYGFVSGTLISIAEDTKKGSNISSFIYSLPLILPAILVLFIFDNGQQKSVNLIYFSLIPPLIILTNTILTNAWKYYHLTQRIELSKSFILERINFIKEFLSLFISLEKHLLNKDILNNEEVLFIIFFMQKENFRTNATIRVISKILSSTNALAASAILATNFNRETFIRSGQESDAASILVSMLPITEGEWTGKNEDSVQLVIRQSHQMLSKDYYEAPSIFSEQSIGNRFAELNNIRNKDIKSRVLSARSSLKKITNIENDQYNNIKELIDALLTLLNPKDFHYFIYKTILKETHIEKQLEKSSSIPFLNNGWSFIKILTSLKTDLTNYTNLESTLSKQAFLRKQQEKLREYEWYHLGWYWQEIAHQIVPIWEKIIEQEIYQTKEWLNLDTLLETKKILLGNNTINLTIKNKSSVLSKEIHLHLDNGDGITWIAQDLRHPILERHAEQTVSIELIAENRGRISISGTLTAQDLDEREYSWPVNFILNIVEQGRIYKKSTHKYYVAGPGLGSDDQFVGRKVLLDAIRQTWLKPENKEALLIVGMRRIGKSSILNKLNRDGVSQNILPIKLDLQSFNTAKAFIEETIYKISETLEISTLPKVENLDPYLTFSRFLRQIKPIISGRYILLMIDEANFLSRKNTEKNYENLPDFLRSTMQDIESPILLLFCGTYELTSGGKDYNSIFYNTANTLKVSYMNKADAYEVLTHPVGDHLEYDPQSLQLAYELTHGHPYLLQSLGKQIISNFDEQVAAGTIRSDYVLYTDMEQAAEMLAQQENAAFDNYWSDADEETRKILSVMAWYLDESSRRRILINQLLLELKEQKLTFEPSKIYEILDKLCREEILTRKENSYRFLIALYRRWIKWRYPPERI